MSQRGQVFRLGDGTWAFRYTNSPGRRPLRPQRGGYPTRADARDALDQELRRLKLGNAVRAEEPLSSLIAEFLGQYEAAPSTVDWVKYHLAKIEAAFGGVPVGALQASEIAKWRKTLKSRDGKSPAKSAHETIRVFRQVLRRGVAWKWISENVADEVDNPQRPREELEPFESWAEIAAIGDELDEHDRSLVYVAVGTGLRPEELFGLERRDLDLDRRVIYVRRAWAKGRLKAYTKTDRSTRNVPLRKIVVDHLAAQLGRVGETQRTIVFPWQSPKDRIEINAWRRRRWRPALEAAGLKVRGPYHLRHTYATWSLAAGVGLFSLARRMGTSIAMVDATYGHLAIDADDVERGLLDTWDAEGVSGAHGRLVDVGGSGE